MNEVSQHNKPASERGLNQALATLEALAKKSDLTVGDVFHALAAQSHLILALIIALPFMLPIPMPGLSIVFGLLIGLAGIAMFLGKDPWLPQFLKTRKISGQVMLNVVKYGKKFARIVEYLIRPRGRFFLKYPWVKRVNGLLIAVCGLLLALPFPPGTNFPPATAICLLTLASLEEDALALFFGYLAIIINILFFALIIFLGYEGIIRLLQAIH